MSTITTTSAASILNSDSTTTNPTAAQVADADSRFADLLASSDDAKTTLSEITSGGATGYWAWQMKQLRQQIAGEVMGDMNLTPAQIAAMPAAQRFAVEQKIEQAVEQRLRLALQEEMKRRQHTTLAQDATLQAVITTAQSIDTSGMQG